MSTSPYNDLLDGCVNGVTGLGLSYNGNALGVSKRKLPAADEQIDTLPLICVVPQDRAETIRQLAFGWVEVTYYVEVVAIAAGQHNLTKDLDVELLWRDQVVGLFNVPRPQPVAVKVPNLKDTDVDPEVPINRAKVNANYDYAGIGLAFKTTRLLGT